jgi:outer membrane receptor protein involved in Fe transport
VNLFSKHPRAAGWTALVTVVLCAGLAAAEDREAPGASTQSAAGVSVSGTVKDGSGAAVPAAEVSLLDAQQALLATTVSTGEGTFSFAGVAAGSYLLRTQSPGFATFRSAVSVGRTPAVVDVVLRPPQLSEEVTVTANPGHVEGVDSVSQSVSVIRGEEIALRAKSVLAQVVNEEVGVHLQRTSPTIAGIVVRGLTGNKVSVFLDGQRYSTGAARGGINTFLDLVDPTSLETVEVLRGPSSAQYGSDALGGSVQLLTRTPALAAASSEVHGSYGVGFGSADNSFGSNLSTTYSSRSYAVVGSLGGRRVNTLRPGGGTDSHNALRRFFDVDPASVLDDGRLPDTAFTQYGGMLKLNWVPSSHDRVVATYQRGQQDGGKRYDQLLGGDGNLVADLRNLMLDYASLKYDRSGFAFFDTLTLGYSFNAQREERVNQGGNGNQRNAINHEYEKTRVHGTQLTAARTLGRHALLLGGDFYAEAITAPSFGFDPVTQGVSVRRGRVPDGARYRNGGVFAQDIVEAIAGRLRLAANVRWSAASYEAKAADSPLVDGKPLWPDDSADFGSVTFRAGAVFTPSPVLSITANVSRGFRAPHITDLGTVGLTGSGFEVSPEVLRGLGATVGSTAGSTALFTGRPADRLDPERSMSYEAALRFHRGNVDTDLVGFVNDIKGNIQKQALILPPGAVGRTLGDQIISRQTPEGAVFVPLSSSPVLVNANFDDARVWGIEHSLDVRPGSDWIFASVLTYLRAEDRSTKRPPNIEGGTPAADAWLRLRYAPRGKRYWIEPYLHAATRQSRLSSLDLEDRRSGATRSRNSIAGFFDNGARARGLIGAGADGLPGTADDVLTLTGETLGQIQARVLGAEAAAPLYTSIPGYAVFGVRGSWSLAAGHDVLIDVENIGDRNYRGISWGVDAPGFGVSVRYTGKF